MAISGHLETILLKVDSECHGRRKQSPKTHLKNLMGIHLLEDVFEEEA